jgi:hypothetical protein
MTDAELTAALGELVAVIRQTDVPKLAYVLQCFVNGHIQAAVDTFDEIVSGAWLGEEEYLAQLRPLVYELVARTPPAHPVDFAAPSRYGHLRG